jgi:hypothetical protein
MTIADFITALENGTPNDWYMTDDSRFRMSALRRVDNSPTGGGRVCCPITSLGREHFTATYWRDAKALGLSDEDAAKIAVTADNLTHHEDFDPILRARLLKATVMREGGLGLRLQKAS